MVKTGGPKLLERTSRETNCKQIASKKKNHLLQQLPGGKKITRMSEQPGRMQACEGGALTDHQSRLGGLITLNGLTVLCYLRFHVGGPDSGRSPPADDPMLHASKSAGAGRGFDEHAITFRLHPSSLWEDGGKHK